MTFFSIPVLVLLRSHFPKINQSYPLPSVPLGIFLSWVWHEWKRRGGYSDQMESNTSSVRFNLQTLKSSPVQKDFKVLLAKKLEMCNVHSQPRKPVMFWAASKAKQHGQQVEIIPTWNAASNSEALSPERKAWVCYSKSREGPWKMIQGVEHTSYEDRLKGLEMSSLGNRRLRGILLQVFNA